MARPFIIYSPIIDLQLPQHSSTSAPPPLLIFSQMRADMYEICMLFMKRTDSNRALWEQGVGHVISFAVEEWITVFGSRPKSGRGGAEFAKVLACRDPMKVTWSSKLWLSCPGISVYGACGSLLPVALSTLQKAKSDSYQATLTVKKEGFMMKLYCAMTVILRWYTSYLIHFGPEGKKNHMLSPVRKTVRV